MVCRKVHFLHYIPATGFMKSTEAGVRVSCGWRSASPTDHPKAWEFDKLGMRLNNQMSFKLELLITFQG